jgi:hypothetical protein
MTLRRNGVAGTEVDGVYFTESESLEGSRTLRELKVEIPGQNKDIRDVKSALAKQVLAAGGNGLTNFKYGQQGNPWWKSLTGLFDAEHWYGSGVAVVMPPDDGTRE